MGDTRPLDYFDYRKDPGAWAKSLGVSREAIDLYLASDVVDLHSCGFSWTRALGYRQERRHRPHLRGTPFFGQLDLPRIREAQLAAMAWSIDTNPLRPAHSQFSALLDNITRLRALFARFPDDFAIVSSHADYLAARRSRRTAIWVAIQGGQALDHDLALLDRIPDNLFHRVTLLHFASSRIGHPSHKPRRAHLGLSPFGEDFVRVLNKKRILVDLAHINQRGFWDALAVHDKSIPPVVTHTGVRTIRQLWRNIDDEQIRAIAERGGTIGIVFHGYYLAARGRMILPRFWQCTIDQVVDHIAHVVRLVGDEFVSLGSDYDGGIALPIGLPDVTAQPKLVQCMLDRGFSSRSIERILGANFLRVVRSIRPG